ncbi:hypothetical protein TNCV_1126711 [Trichonephila clavipes]|nr:hypothetical protein TNCV_1126711 [Trichonephila clavipes]
MRVFCVRDSYGVVRTTIRELSYSTTAAQENQRPCSEKTKVYNAPVHIVIAQVPPSREGTWSSKLPAVIGIRLYGAALKRAASIRECTRSALVKQQSAAH